MPLDRLIFILVCTAAAVALIVMSIAVFTAAIALHPVLGVVLLAGLALALYIIWRVIMERLSNPDDDYYDKMDH